MRDTQKAIIKHADKTDGDLLRGDGGTLKVRRRTGAERFRDSTCSRVREDHNVEIATKYRNDRLTPMLLLQVLMEKRKCRNLVLSERQPCHSR
jgi:hypothetical protein